MLLSYICNKFDSQCFDLPLNRLTNLCEVHRKLGMHAVHLHCFYFEGDHFHCPRYYAAYCMYTSAYSAVIKGPDKKACSLTVYTVKKANLPNCFWEMLIKEWFKVGVFTMAAPHIHSLIIKQLIKSAQLIAFNKNIIKVEQNWVQLIGLALQNSPGPSHGPLRKLIVNSLP